MVHPGDSTSFILCVGISISEATRVARTLRDRVVVLAASDVGAARDLLDGPSGAGAGARSPEVRAEGSPGSRAEGPPPGAGLLRAGPLTVDVAARVVAIGTTDVHLSPREFDVLAVLVSDTHRAWSFAEITERVWHRAFRGDKDQLVSTVKRLRRRLAPTTGFEVRSVPGFGYRLLVG